MKLASLGLSLTLLFTGSIVLPATVMAGPNCTCRYAGGKIEEGQSACIKTPSGMTMARCERVLNNTSWKMLDTPCPYSQNTIEMPNDISLAQLDWVDFVSSQTDALTPQ